MFRRAAFGAEGADGGDIRLEALFLSTVRSGREFDQRVQGNLHPGGLLLRDIHVVGVDAPQDRLMRDDDDVLAALQLHDDRLEADHDIPVAFAAAVAVIVFVLVARSEVFRVAALDFRVREPVAGAGIEFVERLPFQFVVAFVGFREESSCLDCAL